MSQLIQPKNIRQPALAKVTSLKIDTEAANRLKHEQPDLKKPQDPKDLDHNDSDSEVNELKKQLNLDVDIYMEPHEILKLPSLEEEYDRHKGMKPHEIYISYCNKFSRQNLEKNVLNFIDLYQFQEGDMLDGMLPRDMNITCKKINENQAIPEEELEHIDTQRQFELLELRETPNKLGVVVQQPQQIRRKSKQFLGNTINNLMSKQSSRQCLKYFNQQLNIQEVERESFFEFLYINQNLTMMLKTWSKIKIKDQEDEIPSRNTYVKRLSAKLLSPKMISLTQMSKTPSHAPKKQVAFVQDLIIQNNDNDPLNKSMVSTGSVSKRPVNLKRMKAPSSSAFSEQDDFVAKEKYFYIKTIKIFNNAGLLHETMLESFVPDENKAAKKYHKDLTRFSKILNENEEQEPFSYNTSTIQFQNTLFFFRRVRGENSDHKLVLYKLKMNSNGQDFEQTPVNYDGKTYEVRERSLMRDNNDQEEPSQFNCMFVQNIGDFINETKDEQEFLESHYVFFQPYFDISLPKATNQRNMKQFLIFQVSNLNEAITDRITVPRKDINTIEMCFVIESKQSEDTKVRFLLADSEKMTLIKFNKVSIPEGANQNLFKHRQFQLTYEDKTMSHQYSSSVEYCKDVSYDTFKSLTSKYGKIRSEPQIQYHLIDKEKHYFKFDNQGNVQLIYPLYQQKFQQSKMINQIRRKFSNVIGMRPNQFYARIKKTTQQQSEITNVFQEIDNLKKILDIANLDEIDGGLQSDEMSNLQFYFGEDDFQQQICILDPFKLQNNVLRTIVMKNNNYFLSLSERQRSMFEKKANKRGIMKIKASKQAEAIWKKGVTMQLEHLHQHEHEEQQEKKSEKSRSLCSDTNEEEESEDGDFDFDCHQEEHEKVEIRIMDGKEGRMTMQLSLCNKKEVAEELGFKPEAFQILLEFYCMSKGGQIDRQATQKDEKCEGHYFFILVLVILEEQHSQRGKRVYIFLRKTFSEMRLVFQTKNKSILQKEDQIRILRDVNELSDLGNLKQIKTFLINESQAVKEQEDYSERNELRQISNMSFKNIHLTVLRELDDLKLYNFIPFIYQESFNPENNCLMVYDINFDKFGDKYSILPDKNNMGLMYTSKAGFNKYLLCQTTELSQEQLIGQERNQDESDHQIDIFETNDPYRHRQRAKFSIVAFYIEELGRMRVQDLVIYEDQLFNIQIQVVGLKQIFLSNQTIDQNFYQTMIRQATITMCKINKNTIEGCTLVLKQGTGDKDPYVIPLLNPYNMSKRRCLQKEGSKWKNVTDHINYQITEQERKKSIKPSFKKMKPQLSLREIELKNDQDLQLYQRKSKIVLIGNTQFELNLGKVKGDKNEMGKTVQVISVHLRQSVILHQLFENQEALFLLEKATNKILSMRMPDLEYIVMNTFEDIKRNDFFQTQEILEGKSICDISLSDPKAVKEALMTHMLLKEKEKLSQNSILQFITQGDQYRSSLFNQIGFSHRQMLLNYDFNFQGTIQRGLRSKNFISINQILEQIFEHENRSEYNLYIHFDLGKILGQEILQLQPFFDRHIVDKDSNESQSLCSLETPLIDNDLPFFSDQKMQFELIKDIKSYSNVYNEVNDTMKEYFRKIWTPNAVGDNIEIEHFYIDFSVLIISRKIDAMLQNPYQPQIDEFDEVTLSQYLASDELQGVDFYKQESVQRLIDYQWRTSQKFNKVIFFFYVTFYILPMVQLFITPGEIDYHRQLIKIALFPQILMILIEVSQMRSQGLKYFQGWNIFDSLGFTLFVAYWVVLHNQDTSDYNYNSIMKLILVLLMFMKIMYFIRIFEKFAFLVQMLRSCLYDLIPFISCFFTLLFVFSMCLICLNNEIDAEVDEAQQLGLFEKTVLQAFRTSIGELGMPTYTKVIEHKEMGHQGLFDLNIMLIWIVWYIQTFTMLVVMLNFIIAVINQTYDQVSLDQKFINYRYKAELNLECFELLQLFGYPTSFKVIVFSNSIKDQNAIIDPIMINMKEIKKYISQQSKNLVNQHSKIQAKVDSVKEYQSILVSKMSNEFSSIQSTQQRIQDDFEKLNKNQTKNQQEILRIIGADRYLEGLETGIQRSSGKNRKGFGFGTTHLKTEESKGSNNGEPISENQSSSFITSRDEGDEAEEGEDQNESESDDRQQNNIEILKE